MSQLNQARLLSLFGMHAASVMLIRRQLEQDVRTMIRNSDRRGRPTRLGKIYSATCILRKRKVIDEARAKTIKAIYDKASKVAHGNPATRQLCRHLLERYNDV